MQRVCPFPKVSTSIHKYSNIHILNIVTSTVSLASGFLCGCVFTHASQEIFLGKVGGCEPCSDLRWGFEENGCGGGCSLRRTWKELESRGALLQPQPCGGVGPAGGGAGLGRQWALRRHSSVGCTVWASLLPTACSGCRGTSGGC